MDSFYGGKQGISFIIKDKFVSTDEMETKFTTQDYEKVWYGEYCIIDTINKNDPDNGKIFRRTGNHSPIKENGKEIETNHSEYIGQVVGPAGGVPNIELKNLSELDSDFHSLDISHNSMVYYPTTINDAKTYAHETSSITTASVTPTGTIRRTADDNSVIYKSGKDYFYDKNEDGTYNTSSIINQTPAFKYGFYTFQGTTKDSTTGEFPIATIGLGFEVPYVDFDIQVNPTPAHYTGEVSIETKNHNNFYNSYILTVPQGAPGSFIGNIHQENVTSTSNPLYYDLTKDVDFINHTWLTKTPPITGPTTAPSSTSVLVGNYYYYDSNNGITAIMDLTNTSTPAKFLIANNHDIASVTISTTPKPEVTIATTASDGIKVGDEIFNASRNFGLMTVNYKDGKTPYETNLPLLAGLKVVKENNQFKLKAFYQKSGGGNLAPIDIGQTGPEYWGVYGEKLSQTDLDNNVAPTGEGNLGFISENDVVTFYYWDETDNQWEEIGTTGDIQTISIAILDKDLDEENNPFDIQDRHNPIVFKGEPYQVIGGGNVDTFGASPWK